LRREEAPSGEKGDKGEFFWGGRYGSKNTIATTRSTLQHVQFQRAIGQQQQEQQEKQRQEQDALSLLLQKVIWSLYTLYI